MQARHWIWVVVLLAMAAQSLAWVSPSGESIADQPTPTATPGPVCTPPLCQPGEVLYCPDVCPGGCGYQCGTPTPTPTPTAAPGAIVLSGTVYNALHGPAYGISGAMVTVCMSVPRCFSTQTGPDGRYTLVIPPPYAELAQLLQASAPGYYTLAELVTAQELHAQPQRDLALIPWPFRVCLPAILRRAELVPFPVPSGTVLATATATPSSTASPTMTETQTLTATPSETLTPLLTTTATHTPTLTRPPAPTETPTDMATPTPTMSPTPTPTHTDTATPTTIWMPTATWSPTPLGTATPTATWTATPTSEAVLVEAWVSDSAPAQYSTVTVYGKITRGVAGIANVPMHAVWHYKTSTPTCDGVSGADGVASCGRYIGGATKGYYVSITVEFTYEGQQYSATTGFTPQ